jgi:Ca2+-binding EF-hand superfamily protein
MPNREELLKRFDKNGDGELDEEEREAMRAEFGRNRSRTNAPPRVAP